MITLNRLGHSDEPFQLNPDMIVTVESTPDTVITLATGAKVVVAETPAEVAAAVHGYRADGARRGVQRRAPRRAGGRARGARERPPRAAAALGRRGQAVGRPQPAAKRAVSVSGGRLCTALAQN